MTTLRSMRRNDRRDGEATVMADPDLSPAIGDWLNCDPGTGEIRNLSLEGRDGVLMLRCFGAGDPASINWGDVPATPHVSGLGSRVVSGFTARYDFGFMETEIAANLKYGVLVIQSYNAFKDGSGRPAYFTREFFHQDLRHAPLPRTPHAAGREAPPFPFRMASDLPASAPTGEDSGRVDLAPLLGGWRNTYRNSKGIRHVVLSREGEDFFLDAAGIGSDANWGVVPIVPHATGVSSREPAGFLARYRFEHADMALAANEAKGLLIIASFMTFRDGSGRSSYFTREFFYREAHGPGPEST